MLVPQEIPYNPSRGMIVLLLVVAMAVFGAGVLSIFPSRLSFSIATVLFSAATLLVLRRVVWRRHLTVAEYSISVPSGFLRLRPVHIPYEQVLRVWVSRVWVTSVICVKTPNRRVEIQDAYLPDRTVFHDLRRLLESAVPSAWRAK